MLCKSVICGQYSKRSSMAAVVGHLTHLWCYRPAAVTCAARQLLRAGRRNCDSTNSTDKDSTWLRSLRRGSSAESQCSTRNQGLRSHQPAHQHHHQPTHPSLGLRNSSSCRSSSRRSSSTHSTATASWVSFRVSNMGLII